MNYAVELLEGIDEHEHGYCMRPQCRGKMYPTKNEAHVPGYSVYYIYGYPTMYKCSKCGGQCQAGHMDTRVNSAGKKFNTRVGWSYA